MQNREKLTKEELEILAQSYLDCTLSRLQEKELEWILLNTPISSPLIDDCRRVMGLEYLFDSSTQSCCNNKKPKALKRRKMIYRISVAATILIAITCSIILINHAQPDNVSPSTTTDVDVTVYLDGEKLDHEAALSEALMTQQHSMSMIKEIKSDAQNIERTTFKEINEIQNPK